MLKLIDEMAQQSIDFISLLTSLLTFLHKIALLQQADVDWLEDTIDPEKMKAFVAQFKPEDVQLFYQMSLVGQNDLFLAPDPRMGFEMLMLRLLAFKPDATESGEETEKTVAKTSPQPRAKSSPETKKVSSSETKAQVTQSAPALKATPVINDPASKSWSEILGQLGLGGLTGQYAGHCAVKSWTKNQLQLALDPQHASLKDSRAEKMLCKSLEEAFPGLKVKIEIEASSNATPQQQKELKQQEKQSSAEQAIMQDPYVQAFQNKFDAEVVKESIKPVDS